MWQLHSNYIIILIIIIKVSSLEYIIVYRLALYTIFYLALVLHPLQWIASTLLPQCILGSKYYTAWPPRYSLTLVSPTRDLLGPNSISAFSAFSAFLLFCFHFLATPAALRAQLALAPLLLPTSRTKHMQLLRIFKDPDPLAYSYMYLRLDISFLIRSLTCSLIRRSASSIAVLCAAVCCCDIGCSLPHR